MSEFKKFDAGQWINTVRDHVKNSHPRFEGSAITIFRAPPNISQTDRAAYEPSVVTIGPLHNGCCELQSCKWRFVSCLLSHCGKDADRILEECLMNLKARDQEVRGCYSGNLPDKDACELATIMLQDGCFIIYLMLLEKGWLNLIVESIAEKVEEKQESWKKQKEKQEGMTTGVPELDLGSGSGSGLKSVVDLEIGGKKTFDWSLLGNLWTRNLIVYDLLKLGNQIPFFVIKLIFDKLPTTLSNDPGNADYLTNLALHLFRDIYPNKSKKFQTPPPNKIHHLLHLFRSSIVTDWQPPQPAAQELMCEAGTTPKWIPNTTDLALAGVKFKQKKNFDSFLDVSFENGILEVPPLQIYDYTKSLFRNLIAFEQCYHDTNTDITTYAYFMDGIIDTGNDARLLYTKEVLIKGLSTDDEVASLFNQLCNQIHYDPTKNYLNELFTQVNKYHESRWHQWRAVLVRDYFSNPWVIISLLAAVLLLSLTIEQSFFAAFAYFRPPQPSMPAPNS